MTRLAVAFLLIQSHAISNVGGVEWLLLLSLRSRGNEWHGHDRDHNGSLGKETEPDRVFASVRHERSIEDRLPAPLGANIFEGPREPFYSAGYAAGFSSIGTSFVAGCCACRLSFASNRPKASRRIRPASSPSCRR